MSGPVSRRSVKAVQECIKSILFLQGVQPLRSGVQHPGNGASLHESTAYCVAAYLTGQSYESLSVLTRVVQKSKQDFLQTSDSFIDVAGRINDLAVYQVFAASASISASTPASTSTNEAALEGAERQLLRALLMAERSYRPDVHLRASLLGNLSTVQCMRGHASSLLSVGRLVEALQKNSVMGDAALGRDYLPLLPLPPSPPSPSSRILPPLVDADADGGQFLWTNTIFPLLRLSQFYFTAGKVYCDRGMFGEGMVYVNLAFRQLLDCPYHSALYCCMYLADLALLLLKRDDARTEAGGAVASNLSHLRSDYFSEFMQAYAATLVQSSGSSESSESSGSTDSRAMSVALLLRSLSLSSHPLLLLHAAHCVQMLSDVPEGPVPNPNPVPSPRFQLYGGFTQAYEHAIAMHSGGALRAGTGTSTVSDSDSDTHTLTFDAHLLAAQQLQTVPAHTASLVAQLRAANAGLTIHRGIVGVSLMDIRN